jgi:hypothetical protein
MTAAKRKPPECRRCHAPVIWALTKAGKRMPVDKQRDPSGIAALSHAADGHWYVRILTPGEQPAPGVEHRHMPHFATCPERIKDTPDATPDQDDH